MLIALCSEKGSPGTSTSALALASAWDEPAIVVEADPAGGDLGIRLRPRGNALPEAPTVLSLAAAARVDKEPDLTNRHAHVLSPQVSVVPAPLRWEQMAKVGDWRAVADCLRRSPVPVFADLGQIHSGSSALPIAASADVVILVGRPDVTSVVRLRDRLAHLGTDLAAVRGTPARLYAVLVSTARHGQAHANDLAVLLAETSARPFLAGVGFLALDEGTVRRLGTGENPGKRLARTNLMRSGRILATDLRAVIESSPGAAASAAVSGSAR